jgi:hypothetical protein
MPKSFQQLSIAKASSWVLIMVSMNVTPNAHAALVDAGNGLINDTDRNITWTKDAFLFKTQLDNFSAGPSAFVTTIINSVGGSIPGSAVHTLSANDFNTTTGTMNWWGSMAFVGYLNTINFGGFKDWRLPATQFPDAGCSGSTGLAIGENCSGSELGHLYYDELGGVAPKPISEQHNENYDLFINLDDHFYWSGTATPQNQNSVWFFFTDDGFQARFGKGFTGYPATAWAVRDWQASVVPVPSALWLFSSALFALLNLKKCVVTKNS